MARIKQDLRIGESVSFDNGRITITLLEKSGQRARLDIQTPKDTPFSVQKLDTPASVAASQGLKNLSS